MGRHARQSDRIEEISWICISHILISNTVSRQVSFAFPGNFAMITSFSLSTLSMSGVSISLWDTKYLSVYIHLPVEYTLLSIRSSVESTKYSWGTLTISSPISGCTAVIQLPSSSKYFAKLTSPGFTIILIVRLSC